MLGENDLRECIWFKTIVNWNSNLSREEILKQLTSNLPAKFLFNLHLGENKDENWLKKLVVEIGGAYEDDSRQYDAAAFCELLLNKLGLPEEMFKSLRQVYLKCTGQKCTMSPLNAAYDDDKLGIETFHNIFYTVHTFYNVLNQVQGIQCILYVLYLAYI